MRQYLIGLDIGTSGAKCILVDDLGTVVASSTQEYPLYTPRPGWAEQNPEDWWQAVAKGCQIILKQANLPKEAIKGVSFSGQMHGLVALDEGLNVIRPAILWCDQRTQPQCDALIAKAGGVEGLMRLTNNTMLSGYTGGKLIWLKENEPENYARMKTFCCPKDYIRLMITGEVATEVSDASGTGLFDTEKRAWSDGAIALAGLDKALFPVCMESSDLAGRVTEQAARVTGLPQGLPVYAGGGDAVIQTTGAGLVKPGIMGVVIGTAGNVAMGMDRFTPNPGGKLQMFCANGPKLWNALGVTLAAGGAYRWYRDALCEADLLEAKQRGISVYSIMGDKAASSRPGSGGVVFLPYLSGERCPYADSNARGVFYGLSLATTRGDITRSVMEGVTFSLKQVADLMTQTVKAEKIYTSGGGSASPLWRQMQADIFNLPVYTMSAASEGGAYGAVMVAGVGAGVWKDLNEAISILRVETETLPNPANQAAYQDAFGIYTDLYGALKPVYDKAAK